MELPPAPKGAPWINAAPNCTSAKTLFPADIREAPACARDYLVEDVGGGERHEGTEVGELRIRRSSCQSAQAGAMSTAQTEEQLSVRTPC